MAPSPASPSTTVTLDVLTTVLSKLHLSDSISAPKFFDAILQENAEPSKKGLPTSSAHRQAILQLVKESVNNKGTPVPPYKSTVRKVTRDPHSNAKSEKRKKLLELTRSSFPDGEVPTPYVNVWIHAFENLQFIQATLLVTSDDEEHEQEFTNVWCLWDTGAQITTILGSQLNADVKGGPYAPEQGFLSMDISFTGMVNPRLIQSTIGYRPQLPNNSTFIILGQKTLIECMEYAVTPKLVDPTNIPQDLYGFQSLLRYADPVDGETVYVT